MLLHILEVEEIVDVAGKLDFHLKFLFQGTRPASSRTKRILFTTLSLVQMKS